MEKTLADSLKEKILQKEALDQVYESDAGAILRAEMANSISDVVYTLANNYRTLSHTEMIALCAKLDGIIQVSSMLKNAKIMKKELMERMEE